MSLPRFFLDHQVLESESDRIFELGLDADDFKHAKALRLVSGEHIEVIDADSNYYELNVERFDSDGLFASITAKGKSSERLPEIALFQGLPKLDKLDSIIRGATEVGVSEVHPVLCERSVSRPDDKKSHAKHDRWQAIAKSAAMQSGRDSIPKILPIEKLPTASKHPYDAAFIFWEEASVSDAPTIGQAVSEVIGSTLENGRAVNDASIAVWIGPEGGLSESEVETISNSAKNVFVLSLGPTILRTETAGIIAPALVIYEIREYLRAHPDSCLSDQN